MKRYIDRFFQLPGWLLALGALIILVLVSVLAWHLEIADIRSRMNVVRHPERHEGEHVCLSYEKIIRIEGDTVTTVNARHKNFRFVVDTNDVALQQTYSFAGELQADGTVIVSAIHHHQHRTAKYALSLLSFPIIVWLAFRYIRFDRSTRTFMLKPERTDA
ncbi:hypothetical protein JW960_28750 [candidate division KSB1 bacterium]|nr:hypothetical protein [candidate division KSB1 bacterium]